MFVVSFSGLEVDQDVQTINEGNNEYFWMVCEAKGFSSRSDYLNMVQ